MRVLIISRDANAGIRSSTEGNTVRLARRLAGLGHHVHVYSSGPSGAPVSVDGAVYHKVDHSAGAASRVWLGQWRPDPVQRELGSVIVRSWRPDVAVVGAWNGLLELGNAAIGEGVPVVQILHDCSLVCFRQWMLDWRGQVCPGPGPLARCIECMQHTRGWRATALMRASARWPRAARAVRRCLPVRYRYMTQVADIVREAWDHMDAYRTAVSRCIVQAPSNTAVLEAVGISISRVSLVPQWIGADMAVARRRPSVAPGGGDPLQITYVGRCEAAKGYDLLLESLAELQTLRPIQLTIVTHSATEFGTEPVRLRSAPPGCPIMVRAVTDARGAAVASLLAEAHLCVVPSRCMDVASRVVLEAHAQGVPVVCSSTVGNSYAIADGVNGRIFPSGNAQALAACIDEVADDPTVLARWSLRLEKPMGEKEWLCRMEAVLLDSVAERRCDRDGLVVANA